MKNVRGKLVIFILSILLGILISLNSNFDGIKKYFSLSYREYNDAALEKNTLYKEIENLTKANEKTKELIDSYNGNDRNEEEVLALMKEQIDDFGMLDGSREVEGPGLKVTINDGDIHNKENTNIEISNKIFHDRDVQLVINEFRKAGAEAIMINDYRLTANSGLSCNGPFIIFEDDHTEYAPFSFYVIGNPDELEAAILSEESHIKQLELRELDVKIEKKDKIKMPAMTNVKKNNYMQGIVEK
ncbi:MAG: DUF881 domain-containing protein [Clostridium sp.]|uniref:DUF881 domain-containing protein n=1 Tax=Clostridium sp. TaxID=1506 RepID=UPI003F41544A